MAGLVQKMNFLVEESTKLAESLGEANVDSTIKIKFRYHRSGEDVSSLVMCCIRCLF